MKNVEELSNQDVLRIKKFVKENDMKKYITDFLDKRKKEKEFTPKQKYLPKIASGRNLCVQIISAKAFLGFLDPDPSSTITLDISVGGFRMKTKETDAVSDPLFDDAFQFDLFCTAEELVENGPGQICAIENNDEASTIYGIGTFEWRRNITSKSRYAVELIDRNGDVSGVVNIEICITPPYDDNVYYEPFTSNMNKTFSPIGQLRSPIIENPFMAFRFCSLFNIINRNDSENSPIFRPFLCIHSLLSTKSGTITEICALLCSFFSGFGMNAFICGKRVLTMTDNGGMIWNISNGKKEYIKTIPALPLIGCKFKYEPLVESPTFDIEDPRIWRKSELITQKFLPSLFQSYQISEDEIEQEVKNRVSLYRKELPTQFLPQIEKALRPLLFSYENSKLYDSADPWTPYINESIAKLIPKGTRIQLVPICIPSDNPSLIIRSIDQRAKSLLNDPRTDQFVLSLYIVQYPENINVTWLLFGSICKEM